MKKQKNATRIIAIVLVLLMALALIPIAASAEAPDTGTITFDGNGGNTGGETPATTTSQNFVKADTSTALAANPFSRAHYSFTGWNTAANGIGGTSVAGNSTFNDLLTLDAWTDDTLTLYAQWQEDPKYTLTFYANDGTSTSTSSEEYTGTSVELPSFTAPEGCTFSGWAESATGDVVIQPETASVTVGDADRDLYAKWACTISYDANAGTDTVTGMPGPTSTYVNAPTSLSTATPTREGYLFKGWGATSDSTTAVTSVTPYGNTTVYAIWAQTCVISYDTGEGSEVASQTVEVGSATFTLPAATASSRLGYTLTGWKLGEVTYACEAPYVPTENKTFTAVWTEDFVTVKFEPGANATGDGFTDTRKRNTSITLGTPASRSISPASSAYLFSNWTVGTEKYKTTDSITLTADETVVKANYAPACTVTFDSKGGNTISPETVAQGTEITLPPSTRSGYTFLGWYETPDYTGTSHAANSTYTVSVSTDFYAKWLSDNVTFKFEPGDGATGTKADESVTRGQKYTAPTTCTEFTKENYVFAGWKNKEGGADFTELQTNNDTPETVKLVAQWKLDTVTVTLSSKDGSKTKETTMYRSKEEHLTPFSETGIVKPAGNVFLGWAKTPDATAAIFTDEESVQWNGTSGENNYAPDSNAVTLYAVFQEKLSGVVTIENNNGELNDSTNPPRVNQTLTAKIDPTSTPLYYRWKINGKAVEGANAQTFTVRPDDNGKNISVDVTNDETFAYVIPSNAYLVKPDPTQSCTVTVKFAGETPSNFTVRVNGDEKTDGQTVADLAQNSTLNVTLEAGADATVYVSKLQLGNTVIEDDEVATVNLIKVPKSETCDLSVTFTAKGGGTTKTATIDPNADTSAAKTSFTTAVKAKLAQKVAEKKIPADQQNRYWVNALNVVPCWDNQVTNTLKPGVEPTGQIPAEGLKIENPPLPYPAGSDFNATVAANMPKYYDIEVYHKMTDGTVEVIPDARVTKGTAFTAGVTVTGQTDFSPFGVALTPKALDGALKLDADAAYVGTPIKAEYSKTTQGTPNYQWQTKGTSDTDWTNVGTGQTYTPKKDDRNKSLRCVFTSSFETGSVISETVKVGAKPNPEPKQYVINNGNSSYPFAQLGIIGNLSDEMQYYAFPSSSEPTGSSWINVAAGKTESGGLTEGGTYWVRFKDDPENKNWAKVPIGEYFTVTAVPDSVSTNRLYFTASGSYPELIAGKVWRVPKGNSINVTANSGNTNYYKITQLRTKNLKTDYVTVRTINKANTGSTGSFTVNAPYYVSATAGVYGSKTGDSSHLELWVELAALSLMGLGAALVIGRKKLKAQK